MKKSKAAKNGIAQRQRIVNPFIQNLNRPDKEK